MINIRHLGLCDYTHTWEQMRAFTDARDAHTHDEIWLLEHPPVFTQGLRGKAEHILQPSNIPIVQSDRGGQITYHGPGQLIAYVLFDLKRYGLGIRSLVTCLEQAVISLLANYDITGHSRCDAPGVYVDSAKICSLGLRVRKMCSYHGLSLNVAMDLTPFSYINPCGYKDLAVTQLADLVPAITLVSVSAQLSHYLIQHITQHTATEVIADVCA